MMFHFGHLHQIKKKNFGNFSSLIENGLEEKEKEGINEELAGMKETDLKNQKGEEQSHKKGGGEAFELPFQLLEIKD